MSVFQTYRIDSHVIPYMPDTTSPSLYDALLARPVPGVSSADAAYCQDYADEAHVDEIPSTDDWAYALSREHIRLDAAG